MSTTNRNTQSGFIDDSTFPPSAFSQALNEVTAAHVPPTSRELSRFLEYRHAREIGFELPLSAREAAAYVGLKQREIESMARRRKIPTHSAPSVLHKRWKFYASELDAWLCRKICSTSDTRSLNGKETIQ
jgi:hypothetical protein